MSTSYIIKKAYNLLRRVKLNLCNRDVQSGSQIWKAEISKHVCIGRNVNINGSAIGFASYIGDNSSLVRTKIGKYCSIASNVIVASGMHPEQYVSTHPSTYSCGSKYNYGVETGFVEYEYTDETKKYYCEIGNDVWIATGVTILNGKKAIKIHDGAIIRGGSLVLMDIPPYAIVQGFPAKIIGYRFSEDMIKRLIEIKWWDRPETWIKQHAKYMNNADLFLKVVGNYDNQ